LQELAAQKERETAAQAAARAEERVAATDTVKSRIAEKIPFFKDAITSAADSVKSMDFDSLDAEKKAYYALVGESLPEMVKSHRKLLAERDQLLDDLASFEKAQPRVGDLVGNQPAPKKHGDLTSAMLAGLGHA